MDSLALSTNKHIFVKFGEKRKIIDACDLSTC